MAEPGLPDPVAPPRGGYNDFHPPPPLPVRDVNYYVARARRGDNVSGAAWRICTMMQPRSVQEIVSLLWPANTPSTDSALKVTDAYSDWVAAGKPATPR